MNYHLSPYIIICCYIFFFVSCTLKNTVSNCRHDIMNDILVHIHVHTRCIINFVNAITNVTTCRFELVHVPH